MRFGFIKKHSNFNNFVLIPLLVIMGLNIIFFILSSIWDYKISYIFGQLAYIDFFNIFSMYYYLFGYSELFITFIVFALVICEYLNIFLKMKNKITGKSFIIFCYVLCFFIWCGLMFWKIFSQNYLADNDDFIIDKFFLKKTMFVMSIVVSCIQLGILIIFCIFIRYKAKNVEEFIHKKYWSAAIKTILYFFVGYFWIGLLKVSSGRTYYNNLPSVFNERIEKYYEKFHKIFDISNSDSYDNNHFQYWWQFEGLIGNPSGITWDLKIFNRSAFPSGHMMSAFTLGSIFSYFVDLRKKDVTKKQLIVFYLFIFHAIGMNFSFLINGSHWESDLSFSTVLCILTIYFVNLIFDKYILSLFRKMIRDHSFYLADINDTKKELWLSYDNKDIFIKNISIKKIEKIKKKYNIK